MHPTDKTAIRDAATIIVVRDHTSVLMGQRGQTAAFLPGKFVFPGGAIDPNDAHVPIIPPDPLTMTRLADQSALDPHAIAAAAIRELWEETGQVLGATQDWPDAPPGWRGFARAGYIPNAATMQFFFRAVTPAGRPRRFDARFLLANAADLCTDPDDFSGAEDELSHLQWIPLVKAREFDLPFITKVVLAELMAHLKRGGPPKSVPFFKNDDEAHLVSRLGSTSVL